MFRGRRPTRPQTDLPADSAPPAESTPTEVTLATAPEPATSWTAAMLAAKKADGPKPPAAGEQPPAAPAEPKPRTEHRTPRPPRHEGGRDAGPRHGDRPRGDGRRPLNDRQAHKPSDAAARVNAKHLQQLAEDAAHADVDAALEAELAGLDESLLYAEAQATSAAPSAAGDAAAHGHEPAPDVEGERIQLRKGKVIRIGQGGIFFDFGSKTQGFASFDMWEGPTPEVGQECEVEIKGLDNTNNLLIASTQGAAVRANWNNLQPGAIVEARVLAVNKGGLEVEFNSIQGFMPAGQVSLERIEDFEPLIGKSLRAKVLEVRRRERSAVLSAKAVQIEEREANRKALLAELAEGQVRTGTVRQLMPFGAFVDLGGLDGLIHISDLSYTRIKDPAEVVKAGQQVQVKVLKIDLEHTDKRGEPRISLGLKHVMTDPWELVPSQYSVGSETIGKITRLASFGAFCELTPGVEGLIPISEMSYQQRVRTPADVVKEGEQVRVKVLDIDLERRRVSLSLKQLGEDPWAAAEHRFAPGTTHNGLVKRLAQFGAFIELTPGVEGLAHISELSSDRVRSVSDVVKEGQSVTCHVLELDVERKRISLSLREVEPDFVPPAESTSRPVARSPLIAAPAAAPASTPAPAAAPAKPRKERRGGLSWDY